ncbi:hypothetical protein M6B38_318025 [Iris pallida]|uniref:Uncharacterized protein n=1 Tax=Iris pallida TaxID=29817 RepID=A0AAX6HD88_IRIPA|nr:hypothetical protein M6B38_318025 [Iris pallida]
MAAITPATEPSEAEPPPQRQDLGESSAVRGFPGSSGGDGFSATATAVGRFFDDDGNNRLGSIILPRWSMFWARSTPGSII